MTSVVVLTKNWVYWGERSLEDAIKLYFRGKIEIVKADESREIHAGISREGIVFKMPAPLVIRLLNFVGYKIKSSIVNFSKEAVYARDEHICQYYHVDDNGKKYKHHCDENEISLDHIIPTSKGGPNNFLNTVTCCKWHNIQIKRGRTPKEAGLELIREPFVPKRNKGDMAIISFNFNPKNKAHMAFQEIFGVI